MTVEQRHISILNCSIAACINPTLSIASTLVRRGYRVSYVAKHPYRQQVETLGAETVPWSEIPSDLTLPPAARCQKYWDQAWSEIWPFYEAHQPDLVVHDVVNVLGPVIARRLEIPSIRMTPGVALHGADLDRQLPPGSDFRVTIDEWTQGAKAFLASHGIAKNDPLYEPEQPTIFFFLGALQISQHSCAFYAARCAAERPYHISNVRSWPASSGRILVTASTIYTQEVEYYEMCLNALRGLGYEIVVMSKTEVISHLTLPPNTTIISDAPQITVLPHVSLMIGLGGMVTQMEAAYHGVPILMLTQGNVEAELYADNAERHGLGVHLRAGQTSEDSIRSSVVTMLQDATLRRRVRELQKAVRHSAGAEDVCNWLEDHLSADSDDLGLSRSNIKTQSLP